MNEPQVKWTTCSTTINLQNSQAVRISRASRKTWSKNKILYSRTYIYKTKRKDIALSPMIHPTIPEKRGNWSSKNNWKANSIRRNLSSSRVSPVRNPVTELKKRTPNWKTSFGRPISCRSKSNHRKWSMKTSKTLSRISSSKVMKLDKMYLRSIHRVKPSSSSFKASCLSWYATLPLKNGIMNTNTTKN